MIKYNHEGEMSSDAVGVTEEVFNETSERVIHELRSMLLRNSVVSEIAEAIETWLAYGTDTEKAIKYLHLAKTAQMVRMV